MFFFMFNGLGVKLHVYRAYRKKKTVLVFLKGHDTNPTSYSFSYLHYFLPSNIVSTIGNHEKVLVVTKKLQYLFLSAFRRAVFFCTSRLMLRVLPFFLQKSSSEQQICRHSVRYHYLSHAGTQASKQSNQFTEIKDHCTTHRCHTAVSERLKAV